MSVSLKFKYLQLGCVNFFFSFFRNKFWTGDRGCFYNNNDNNNKKEEEPHLDFHQFCIFLSEVIDLKPGLMEEYLSHREKKKTKS